MKRYADSNRTERKFDKGDWVYLKLQPYRQLTLAGVRNQKLGPKYYGPFEILQRVGTVAYRLNLPPKSTIHPVFHVSQLKSHVGNGQAVSPSIPMTGPKEMGQLVPQTILARRMVKQRNAVEVQLVIQWQNQEVEDAT